MFEPDGPVAGEIAGLWWFMLVLGVAVFALFTVVLVAGLRRRRAEDAGGDAGDPRTARRMVVGWGAVMPAIVLTIVLGFTIETMRAVPTTAPRDALRIDIVGHRWWYEIRYPEHGITTANELHLPVDRPVELRLSSDDVIHSVWIPALAGKMDLLPDRTNTLILEADEPGEHRTFCAEFCGLQHARMGLLVLVEPDDEFASWLAASAEDAVEPPTAAAARGEEVFVDAGCASCHTVRGTGADGAAGPDLTHLASRRTIAAATVSLTRQNLLEWITDPDGIKRGVEMPPTDLSESEMEALLTYLGSLR